MDQLMPAPASVGSASFSTTAVAGPVPSLLTTIVNPTGLPARTLWASGTLVTLMCGLLRTQMPSRSVLVVLPDVTVAVLSRLAEWPLMVMVQSAIAGAPAAGAVVGLMTWTEADAPAARSPKLQVRFTPATAQVPTGLLDATLQVIPRPAMTGSGSVSVTAGRVVLPVLVAVIVKPTWVPEMGGALCGVLTTFRPGFVTTETSWHL